MALSNRWLRSGAFALVTARHQPISARELPDPTEPCRTTSGVPTEAAASARGAVDLETHRGVLPGLVHSLFGVDLRTCMIQGLSLGSRQ